MKASVSNLVVSSFLLLTVLFFNGCAPTIDHSMTQEIPPSSELAPVEKMEEVLPPVKEQSAEPGLTVIGEIEPVTIVSPKLTMPARIDTGATTSSLDAQDIKQFERDGKPWVRFSVKDRKTGKISKLESHLTRVVEIKRHGGEPQMRPVAKLKMKLGSATLDSEFSLTDRSLFEYPILIGRNVLEGVFIVDVSKKNSTALMAEESDHAN